MPEHHGVGQVLRRTGDAAGDRYDDGGARGKLPAKSRPTATHDVALPQATP